MTRKLRLGYLLTIAGAIVVTVAPGVSAHSLKCESQQARYNAIHAKVKKLQAKVDYDGSGAVTPKVFVADLRLLQQAKLQQTGAARTLQNCKR